MESRVHSLRLAGLPRFAGLEQQLRSSLAAEEQRLRRSVILNPVENIPFAHDLAAAAGPLHGLYNSDKVRSREDAKEAPIQFAGRGRIAADVRQIYEAWAKALGAADATLRPLSGLNAHMVLFMALARPGDRVLLLPVEAGGHLSGKAILERLGLEVVNMLVDVQGLCVDIDGTLARFGEDRPEFVFVDRSEGLVFEDFGRLTTLASRAAVFDGSQYLTNILTGDYPNPMSTGFGLFVASTHKSFPGPQKALLATRDEDANWHRILRGASTYVSNMHVGNIYAAGLTLARHDWLVRYGAETLAVAVRLEEELAGLDVPMVRRRLDTPPTQHLWIHEPSREQAFVTYERLEKASILTNFRQLPYALGHGIRLGVSASVRLGMTVADVPVLAELVATVRRAEPSTAVITEVQRFAEVLWERAAAEDLTSAAATGTEWLR